MRIGIRTRRDFLREWHVSDDKVLEPALRRFLALSIKEGLLENSFGEVVATRNGTGFELRVELGAPDFDEGDVSVTVPLGAAMSEAPFGDATLDGLARARRAAERMIRRIDRELAKRERAT